MNKQFLCMRVLLLCGVLLIFALLIIYNWKLQPVNQRILPTKSDSLNETGSYAGENETISYDAESSIFPNISNGNFDVSKITQETTTDTFEATSVKEIETTKSPSTTTDDQLHCPSGPIVSFTSGGRLGNKIWEYAAAWATARLLDRPGYAEQALLNDLGKIFYNLTFKPIESISQCNIQFGKPIINKELPPCDQWEKKFKNRNILLAKYIFLVEPVLLFKKFLPEEFQVQPDLSREVEETIKSVGGSGRIRVGVHVRRTDFKKVLPMIYKSKVVGPEFFLNAMQKLRTIIPGKLIFLIVSDDLDWCRKNLLKNEDVVIASKTVEHDMALLMSSNHTIIDYGTFGFWGALISSLKGGHTMSLQMESYFNRQMAKQNKKWHLVRN